MNDIRLHSNMFNISCATISDHGSSRWTAYISALRSSQERQPSNHAYTCSQTPYAEPRVQRQATSAPPAHAHDVFLAVAVVRLSLCKLWKSLIGLFCFCAWAAFGYLVGFYLSQQTTSRRACRVCWCFLDDTCFVIHAYLLQQNWKGGVAVIIAISVICSYSLPGS